MKSCLLWPRAGWTHAFTKPSQSAMISQTWQPVQSSSSLIQASCSHWRLWCVCLSVCLVSVCQSVCQSVSMSVCLSLSSCLFPSVCWCSCVWDGVSPWRRVRSFECLVLVRNLSTGNNAYHMHQALKPFFYCFPPWCFSFCHFFIASENKPTNLYCCEQVIVSVIIFASMWDLITGVVSLWV